MPEPAVAEPDLWDGLEPLLDQELSRLPDKYRAVIVLCDLEGKTRKEAARQLGLPEGTVGSRLARARAMLAKRLARHGPAVSGGVLAAVLSQKVASGGVPTSVLSSTIKAAGLYAAGQAVSAQVVALTEGVLKTMLLTRLRFATAVVFVMTLICCGAGILASHAQEGKKAPAPPSQVKEDDNKLKDTLLALDTKYWDAWTKGKGDGDAKVVDKLLAEDYLCIWADDPPIDKAAAFEGVKHYRYSDRTIRDVEVRPVSKDAAVLTYACSMKVSVDEQEPVSVDYRGSYVWARRDGGWVLVFQHAHPVQAKEQQALPSPFGK
jgi:ketosteroid isomerase-like protein